MNDFWIEGRPQIAEERFGKEPNLFAIIRDYYRLNDCGFSNSQKYAKTYINKLEEMYEINPRNNG